MENIVSKLFDEYINDIDESMNSLQPADKKICDNKTETVQSKLFKI
jgi:hypothetical protein